MRTTIFCLPPLASTAALTVGSLWLAACTVGPTYLGPPDAAPLSTAAGQFRRAAPTNNTAAPPARWWDALKDPVLTTLIDRALAHSPTLRAAQARVLEARATVRRDRAAGLPSATATGIAVAANVPAGSPLAGLGGSSGSSASSGAAGSESSSRENFNFYSAGFDALWELDLFGGVRRSVEGARANVGVTEAILQDAQVQLAAEVGQAYVSLRGQQALLALARSDEANQQKLLALTEARVRGGTAGRFDVERATSQLIVTRANAAPLPGQVAQSLDRLALLAGQEPGTLDGLLLPEAPLPVLPEAVSLGDPAAMLRRRPDVRAAERALAASSAGIGQAIAQRFPSVTLFGNIGFSNGQFPKLFDVNSLALLGGPVLRWNFLNFGKTEGAIDQSRAANEQALANYDATVLAALQDAESSLARFGQQRQTVYQRMDALSSAERTVNLANVRYLGGTATLLDVLAAESQKVQIEQTLAQSRAMLVTDYVSLQKSLGLGWQPVADADAGSASTSAAITPVTP